MAEATLAGMFECTETGGMDTQLLADRIRDFGVLASDFERIANDCAAAARMGWHSAAADAFADELHERANKIAHVSTLCLDVASAYQELMDQVESAPALPGVEIPDPVGVKAPGVP